MQQFAFLSASAGYALFRNEISSCTGETRQRPLEQIGRARKGTDLLVCSNN